MRDVRIGAVNWDCSLPPDTYFGYYQTRSLSPQKFRTVTPFYADVLGDNSITYHYRTQEEFDTELRFALDAGIDYFAYVWYGEEGSRNCEPKGPNSCSHKVYELTYARKMHLKSALREKLHLCAIAGAHPFTENDIRELVLAMREPFYEKIDGKPLLYVFNGRRMDFIEAVRKMCAALQVTEPFVVPLMTGMIDPVEDCSGVDALSAYTCEKSGIDTYKELSDTVIAENESRRQTGMPVIPLYSTGWDPSPRVEHPCPWYGYPNVQYTKFASEEELLEGADALVSWIREKAAAQFAGHILSFAWNEFEEGGIICPVMNERCETDISRLKAFRKVSDYFKNNLKTL